MMYDEISESIKVAMKEHDVVTRDCLRMAKNKAKIIAKDNHADNITDEIMISAISKELKQLHQTLDALHEHEDGLLYCETVKSIELLEQYMPKMLSRKEVESEVEKILANGNYPSYGCKMKVVMAKLKGRADGSVIRDVVSKF